VIFNCSQIVVVLSEVLDHGIRGIRFQNRNVVANVGISGSLVHELEANGLFEPDLDRRLIEGDIIAFGAQLDDYGISGPGLESQGEDAEQGRKEEPSHRNFHHFTLTFSFIWG
jgi:hypothetical protein